METTKKARLIKSIENIKKVLTEETKAGPDVKDYRALDEIKEIILGL